VNTDGYGFQIEMNFKVWRKGMRLKEIPILFVDRRVGISKMNNKIVWEAMWLVWKLRVQDLLGRL
jgi:dolichol-phosphate mannosyltransferase